MQSAVAPALTPTPQTTDYKIKCVNRDALLAVLIITAMSGAFLKLSSSSSFMALAIYLIGITLLESWKLWLGFGIFRRLSGNPLIGIVYVVSICLSVVPLLGWIVCAVANDMAGKAVMRKLGKKPSNWVYFGWIGLFHLQGLLNKAASAPIQNTIV